MDVKWANPVAMDRALAAKAEGRAPDFTITGAKISHVDEGPPKVVVVTWETQSAGFGELAIAQFEDGRVELETEGMGHDFCTRVLAYLITSGTRAS